MTILVNIKDFVFLILTAIVTVLLVYYVNDGVYRYQSIAGVLAGYFVCDLVFGKLIVKARNSVLGTVFGALSFPLMWIWHRTFGALLVKADRAALIRNTEYNNEYLMLLASNGFENNTEAKAWKRMKSNRMLRLRAQNRE
ncbi:MAG: spore cortex biosynthesis protein YabQ [Clostridia bacterium]|nr:spore cortex biosynthesis protein YabQ [Clostridia bacterium]